VQYALAIRTVPVFETRNVDILPRTFFSGLIGILSEEFYA